jgi:hypothetical protein
VQAFEDAMFAKSTYQTNSTALILLKQSMQVMQEEINRKS